MMNNFSFNILAMQAFENKMLMYIQDRGKLLSFTNTTRLSQSGL